MAQDEDLQVLGGVAPGEQGEQLDGTAQCPVGEFREHAGGPPQSSSRGQPTEQCSGNCQLKGHVRLCAPFRTFVQPMKWGRWYPTLLTVGDGRAMATSGGGNSENELYSQPAGWQVSSPPFGWPLYPHLHLLADGRVFHSGMRFGGSN